jgi:hypothetical protein
MASNKIPKALPLKGLQNPMSFEIKVNTYAQLLSE